MPTRLAVRCHRDGAEMILRRCGEALYGERWQSPLARDLDISDRHMRRMVSGAADVPDGVYLDLHRLLTERAAEIDDLLAALPEAATPR